MKNIMLVRTRDVTLAPAYDTDYKALQSIPLGDIITVDLSLERNPGFHRKFFAMIRFFYEHMPEIITDKYPDPETFRRQFLFYYCGVTEEVTDWKGERHIIPKSVSYGAMDDAEFREIYEAIREKIVHDFFPDIQDEEFESELINFM